MIFLNGLDLQCAGQVVVKVTNDYLALVQRLHIWLEVRIADAKVNKKLRGGLFQ